MTERNYSLKEVKEMISITQKGKDLIRCRKFTQHEYDLLAQNLKDMEKYPAVFGKKEDEESRFGILSMLEKSIRDNLVTSTIF